MTSDLPLSAAQLGVWYALKAGAPVSGYNIAEYIRISGEIDPALYEATLRQVVDERNRGIVRSLFRDRRCARRQQIVADRTGAWCIWT